MKNLLLLLMVCCLSSLKGFGQDINGVWADSSSASFNNCYAVFSEQNDSIHMAHYIEFNGTPFVEYGSGIIQNGKYIYTVYVTKQIPGWTTTQGKHILELSSDGNTLRGTYSDNSGNTGPLVFKRMLPAPKQ